MIIHLLALLLLVVTIDCVVFVLLGGKHDETTGGSDIDNSGDIDLDRFRR